MRSVGRVVGLVGLLLAACSTGPTSGTTSPVVSPLSGSSAELTASPSVGASAPPALVGEWAGVHNCDRIAALLHDAGLDVFIRPTIVGNGLLPGVDDPEDVRDFEHPCLGAIELAHSHFFTAAGLFGSRDQNGQQVDDGTWTSVDDATFRIGDRPTDLFRYAIVGDELTMEPVSLEPCSPNPADWCQAGWKLMVAMPGTAWTRVR